MGVLFYIGQVHDLIRSEISLKRRGDVMVVGAAYSKHGTDVLTDKRKEP